MTERGTTGAEELQFAGVPRVHRSLELHGRGTTGDDISHGQTRVGHTAMRPWIPPAMIHGSMVAAGLLDPSEGETEEPTHVGRWRQQKGPGEPQAAVEKERINEYQLQRDAMPTAMPRAGALQGVVPLHRRQPGAYSAQGVEATKANEVSDDELETEYQEAMALPTIVKQRRARPQYSGDHKAELDKVEQKLLCVRWRHNGPL